MDKIEDDLQKARQLRAWLTTFTLPPRVINPLRRALEVVLGEREGVPDKGDGLAGIDCAQFVVELYRPEGGVIRTLPAVGALVIEALREVIPPPPPPRMVVAAKPIAPPPANEGWREFEIEDLLALSIDDPDPIQAQPVVAPDQPPSLPPPAEIQESASDDSVAPLPRRRGRPRKQVNAALGPTLPRIRPVLSAAPVLVTPPPTVAAQEPTPPEVAFTSDLDESQLRQIWRVLHPQGRRAVIGYISELLI
ncbi:MAG: hypothetical protein WCF99_17910 [Chloroflexales bacterium]